MGPSGLVSGRRERLTQKGCEGFQQLNVLLKGLRRVIGGHVDGAQAPGVGDRGGQLGLGEPLHGALNDGILNAEQVGDARFHGASSWME